MLAHLRNGDTYRRLAGGFGIGTTTAWRYVPEAVDLLAATAEDLSTPMVRVGRLAYAILHGTTVPIDRLAHDRPYYSESTSGTVSTCRYSPIRPAIWCGPRRRCPGRCTTYHRKRDSIGAHLTIVFAALAVSRWIETRTGWSIKKFVRTAATVPAPSRSMPTNKPLPPRTHYPTTSAKPSRLSTAILKVRTKVARAGS